MSMFPLRACLVASVLLFVEGNFVSASRPGSRPQGPGLGDKWAGTTLQKRVERPLPLGESGDWSVAETANFRIYHKQSWQLVDQVGRLAEQTRLALGRKWLGDKGTQWHCKCNVYLHATLKDYWREKRVAGQCLGHCSYRTSTYGQVVARYLEMPCDQTELFSTILPHEVTHQVVQEDFDPLPVWANEGMAALAEAPAEIDRRLRLLVKSKKALFNVGHLMDMTEYPGQDVLLFYSQSMSLVDYLVGEKGPGVFLKFAKDGLKNGYAPALRRHYGIRNCEELERRWLRHTFEGEVPAPGFAGIMRFSLLGLS